MMSLLVILLIVLALGVAGAIVGVDSRPDIREAPRHNI